MVWEFLLKKKATTTSSEVREPQLYILFQQLGPMCRFKERNQWQKHSDARGHIKYTENISLVYHQPLGPQDQ